MNYTSSLHMQRNVRLSRNANISSRAAVSALGPVSNVIFLIVIISTMFLLYLSQITKANEYSFTISKLETQKTALQQENQDLAVEAARLSSIERVSESEVAKAMGRPRSVDFVR